MTSLKEFLTDARTAWPAVSLRYVHPSIYLIVTDGVFEDMDQEERNRVFFSKLQRSSKEAEPLIGNSNLLLVLVTPEEREDQLAFLNGGLHAHHWIEFMTNADEDIMVPRRKNPRIVHFYGFKGGQGRSTILSTLARVLADDGFRVLAVDADIEAPSLPAQFGVRIDPVESTLLGCVQFELDALPQQAYVAKTGHGFVDLIACKPSGGHFDLDLAVFALNTALDPQRLQRAFERLLDRSESYDMVFIDHRSGIASSVLPLVSSFPGPTVICMRLDEQSDEADEYIKVLLDRNPDSPGIFISFSLDPEDSDEKVRARSGARIERLLDILAVSIEGGQERNGRDDVVDTVAPDEISSYWVSWHHDRRFLSKPAPTLQELTSANRDSIAQVRELLAIPPRSVRAEPPKQTFGLNSTLTNSGSTDEGLLIETDALRKLRSANSNFRYVFGRKGTGKTRLVRTLVDESLGDTLLSAEDDTSEDSISSADPTFQDIASILFHANAADRLWWVVLDCALHGPSGKRLRLQWWLEKLSAGDESVVRISEISARIQTLSEHQVFLIDGVETSFTSVQMPVFVQGLFRFLGLVQANSQIASKLTIRLFLRTDLVQFGSENVEQQVDGRSLTLSWDTQSILNFALTRLAALEWFRDNFSTAINKIEAESDRLSEGELSIEDCDSILLEIFPEKFRRNNLRTLTFLKTYFSEGEGDTASFYPRIYDAFLRGIATPSIINPAATRIPQIEEDRVGQQLIVVAHDYASGQYLQQVVHELRNLVRLSDEPKENARRVESLLPAFRGLPTPFKLSASLLTVQQKLKAESDIDVDRDRLQSALEQMKRVGIFEDRPGYGGWWRAGRLFKNALGMKYVR